MSTLLIKRVHFFLNFALLLTYYFLVLSNPHYYINDVSLNFGGVYLIVWTNLNLNLNLSIILNGLKRDY